MKNIINIIFIVLLFFISLLSLWESISPNKYENTVTFLNYQNGEVEKVKQFEPPNYKSNLFIPLGCNEDKYDYAIVLSNAFKFNLKLSTAVTIVFLFFGILFGLLIGFNYENVQIKSLKKINFIDRIIQSFFDGAAMLTDTFQSIPTLVVILLSVSFFDAIFDSKLTLLFTLVVFAIVSTPKLSIPLSSIVKQLKREEFILAAKASGVSMYNLIFKQILFYEVRGLIIIQMANFFVQTIMIEVFLTYIDKGASNNSLGILMKTNGSALAMGFDNNDSYQQIFIVIAPYLFLVVLCLLTRWIAQRTLIILDN